MVSRPIARALNTILKDFLAGGICVGLSAICCFIQPSHAQISEYTDCSEYGYNSQDNLVPLTTDERLARLDNIFYPKIADISKCENKTEGGMTSASNGGASDASGASGASGEGGVGGASLDKPGESSSISTNDLKAGETSVGMTNTKYPVADLNSGSPNGTGSKVEIDEGNNGKKQDELDSADNVAALRAQIKAQIQAESDPEIKTELRKQYEALK